MKIFQKIITFIFIFLAMQFVPALETSAVTLTHPESQYVTVDKPGIFFSGKIHKYEHVYINGIRMYPERNGAFSYSISLKSGENIVAVQSKELFGKTHTITYHITFQKAVKRPNQNVFLQSEKAYYQTTKDDVVMRSTPVDAGMNRLGYLPNNTKLVVDGTFNEFSRVYLSEDNYGWVFTKNIKIVPKETKPETAKAENKTNIKPVKQTETVTKKEVKTAEPEKENVEEKAEPTFEYKPVTVTDTNTFKTVHDETFVIQLSDNAPYSAIVDNNKLVVTVYNVDSKSETYKKTFNLGKFPRYSVCMKDGVLYVIQKKVPFTKQTYSNRKVFIVIDPGHGGQERGAVGCFGDIEKNLNLKVALELRKYLEKANFRVRMTRETDKFMTLNDRVKFGQDNDALFFISIHLNSVPISSNPNLNEGTVVFYFNPQGEELAKTLAQSISTALKVKNEGASQASFAVIRPTEYIGVLAELAYLVNPKDVRVYRSMHFARTSARAIYNGLVKYINEVLK